MGGGGAAAQAEEDGAKQDLSALEAELAQAEHHTNEKDPEQFSCLESMALTMQRFVTEIRTGGAVSQERVGEAEEHMKVAMASFAAIAAAVQVANTSGAQSSTMPSV